MAEQTVAQDQYGLMAEFDSAPALLDAARRVNDAGYTHTDAFSPIPIHGLAETLGMKEWNIPPIVLTGGLAGLIVGVSLEYYCQVIGFPLNIGGRPLASWVAWIPPAFETTILFASFSALIGMLALNGLPRPYHPVFNVERFSHASQDAFFLVIEAVDPKFDARQTRAFLESLHPREVVDVEE